MTQYAPNAAKLAKYRSSQPKVDQFIAEIAISQSLDSEAN